MRDANPSGKTVLKFDLKKPVVLLGLVVMLYGGMSLTSLLRRSPFAVSVEKACELGRWDLDQVRFQRGSYRYRFLVSMAEAELQVETSGGSFPVRIELLNSPFTGWTVRSLELESAAIAGRGT